MAGLFSRFVTNFKFPLRFKRFSSQTFIKPEIRNASEEVYKLSTLFVSGRHGADTYQIVKPVIDIDYIVNNLGNLKLSCDHRGIEVDLDYVLQVTKEWLIAKEHFLTLVEKDQGYLTELNRLNSPDFKDKLLAIQEKRSEFLETLLTEKTKLHDIEDIVMPLFKKIPHVLHPNTPLQFNVIDVCQEPIALDSDIKSHTEISKHISFIDNADNQLISCFIVGKLAELDFGIQMYFADKLNNCGFFPLAGVDFCKSFIIEAIGNDPYSSLDCIQIKGKRNRELGQKLNLVGGASFETFCAYFANMNVNKSTLPFKYFSLGRRYNAANKSNNSRDLFSVVQSTNIHGLVISECHSVNYFDTLLQVIIECYSELNVPFRIVNIASKNLTIAESHKKQLELWSPALKKYVPVAYVSQHDDFVSKRLQITYGFHHEKEGHCHIVEGTIVNIPTLIGCIIENFQMKDGFNVPSVLEKYLSYSE